MLIRVRLAPGTLCGMKAVELCPCGLGERYPDCCGRLHRGEVAAPTAELLMRSRFSAFATGAEAYLLDTWHPSTRPQQLQLDRALRWTRLEILATTGGGFLDPAGTVAFRAHFTDRGRPGRHEEDSRFVREGGRWFYLDAATG